VQRLQLQNGEVVVGVLEVAVAAQLLDGRVLLVLPIETVRRGKYLQPSLDRKVL